MFGAVAVVDIGCLVVRKWVAFFADSPAITARVSTSASVVSFSTRFIISVIASPTRCVCAFKADDKLSRWRPVTVLWALSGS